MGLLNRQTGEALIDGTQVHVLFTAEAYAQLEQTLGLRSGEMMQRYAMGNFGFIDAQALILAGSEGWRRRHGNGAAALNPTKALKTVEAGGGLMKVMAVLMDSVKYSQALGMTGDEEREPGESEDDDEDPGTGGAP